MERILLTSGEGTPEVAVLQCHVQFRMARSLDELTNAIGAFKEEGDILIKACERPLNPRRTRMRTDLDQGSFDVH